MEVPTNGPTVLESEVGLMAVAILAAGIRDDHTDTGLSFLTTAISIPANFAMASVRAKVNTLSQATQTKIMAGSMSVILEAES
jgi:hypothetical protein